MNYLKLSFKSGVWNINNLPILMIGATILTAALLFPINSVQAATFSITVDASSLNYGAQWMINVAGIGGFDSLGMLTASVAPGTYTFSYWPGRGFQFSVDNNGKIQYDPSLESFLSGAGTSVLKVDGFTVTVD
ncbi:MAG: hypothetical protein HZB99_00920, partial [Candidatus Harrisonbacteria bacterium]|nr:hypothetical protein [Candidatus Harrisonbacteria bacterium]